MTPFEKLVSPKPARTCEMQKEFDLVSTFAHAALDDFMLADTVEEMGSALQRLTDVAFKARLIRRKIQ